MLAYVALGSNLGDSCQIVTNAIYALDKLPNTRLGKVSSLYRTAPLLPYHPQDPVSLPLSATQPDFINAVAALHTRLAPLDLLTALQAEEAAQGRVRSIPNAPRTLDLDVLLYADVRMCTPTLTLPHPRMHLRAFVLVPLSEIAPAELVIPGRGRLAAWLPAVAGQRISRL